MKILITGANGLVGKNFLEGVNSRYIKIIATSNDEQKLAAFIKKNQIRNVIVKKLDVLKPKDCISVIKDVDIVLHLAAIIYIQQSLNNPKKIIDVNYNGTLNVLEAMRQNNVEKIIFPSTQDIYGNNINSKEDDIEKIAPTNMYSLSKLLCEDTIKMYSNIYNMYYIILRASHLYGKHQYKGLLPLLIVRTLKHDVVEIGNNIRRDFLNAKDFVQAIMMYVKWKNNNNNVFNVGTGTSTSIKEVINIIAESLNKKVKIAINKKLIRNPSIERWNELANIDKIKKVGWKPEYNMREWIEENVHSFSI